jgi:hypothetical protein
LKGQGENRSESLVSNATESGALSLNMYKSFKLPALVGTKEFYND